MFKKKCNAKGKKCDYIYVELNVDIDGPGLFFVCFVRRAQFTFLLLKTMHILYSPSVWNNQMMKSSLTMQKIYNEHAYINGVIDPNKKTFH